MSNKTAILDQEIASLLKSVREKSGLYQKEVAKRIGLSVKSGKGYISHLEKGMVKNPPIGTILLYLRACGESWSEFFKQLDIIDFKMRHERMITQLPIPPEPRKVERAAMRYETGIEFPSKQKDEIDFTRLKKQIKDKVLVLLTKNQVEENQINSYQRFASEFFDFLAALNKAGMKMVTNKYQRAGLHLHLISKIKKIINSVLRGEIKRIEANKPLPTKKQEKMAIGFTKYRIRIEKIEAEVHKVLCEIGVPTTKFGMYKAFSRECYRVLKKYYGKESLDDKFQTIIKRWIKEGLKEDVLLKVRDATIKAFTDKNT